MPKSSDKSKSKPKPSARRSATAKPAIDLEQLEEHIEMLRPALKSHGGNIELIGVDGGVVLVKLTGACAGCAMAQLTLKEGVEKFLVKRVKGVTEVRAEGLAE
jgi:Fe-S cluster biogenesis protein NfuA